MAWWAYVLLALLLLVCLWPVRRSPERGGTSGCDDEAAGAWWYWTHGR